MPLHSEPSENTDDVRQTAKGAYEHCLLVQGKFFPATIHHDLLTRAVRYIMNHTSCDQNEAAKALERELLSRCDVLLQPYLPTFTTYRPDGTPFPRPDVPPEDADIPKDVLQHVGGHLSYIESLRTSPAGIAQCETRARDWGAMRAFMTFVRCS